MASHHHSIKSGKKGTAREHARYIERDGKYSDREDLIHSSHGNLPDWAEGDPLVFWRAADTFERTNGAVYREHEIALPNELGTDALRDLAEAITQQLAGSKTYQLGVHVTESQLGGILNPHMHLMYSDRVPDGIPRSPEQWFSRYDASRPEKGGCRKDSGGRTPIALRAEITATRKTIAECINEALITHGFSSRVDHRSLRDQGVDREPEWHQGQARVRAMSDESKAQFVSHRYG